MIHENLMHHIRPVPQLIAISENISFNGYICLYNSYILTKFWQIDIIERFYFAVHSFCVFVWNPSVMTIHIYISFLFGFIRLGFSQIAYTLLPASYAASAGAGAYHCWNLKIYYGLCRAKLHEQNDECVCARGRLLGWIHIESHARIDVH